MFLERGMLYECWTSNFFFLFFLFLAAPMAYGTSQARDQIQASAATYVTAVATLILNPLCLGWGLNL